MGNDRRGLRVTLAVASIPIGICAVAALHVLQPGVDPTSQYISEYANAPWGWLLRLALVSVAIGALALASGLHEATRTRLGPILLAAVGICLGVAAALPTDRFGEEIAGTLAGKVHGVAAVTGFVILVAAMLVLAGVFGEDERWRPLDRATAPLAIAAVALAALTFAALPEADGLRQRGFLAIVFTWLMLAAMRLRDVQPEEPEEPSGSHTDRLRAS